MSDDESVPHQIQAVPESVDSDVSTQQPVQRNPPFQPTQRATRRLPFQRQQLRYGEMVQGVVRMLLRFTSNSHEAREMIDFVKEIMEEEYAERFTPDNEYEGLSE